jgi:hypothetical protein
MWTAFGGGSMQLTCARARGPWDCEDQLELAASEQKLGARRDVDGLRRDVDGAPGARQVENIQEHSRTRAQECPRTSGDIRKIKNIDEDPL